MMMFVGTHFCFMSDFFSVLFCFPFERMNYVVRFVFVTTSLKSIQLLYSRRMMIVLLMMTMMLMMLFLCM